MKYSKKQICQSKNTKTQKDFQQTCQKSSQEDFYEQPCNSMNSQKPILDLDFYNQFIGDERGHFEHENKAFADIFVEGPQLLENSFLNQNYGLNFQNNKSIQVFSGQPSNQNAEAFIVSKVSTSSMEEQIKQKRKYEKKKNQLRDPIKRITKEQRKYVEKNLPQTMCSIFSNYLKQRYEKKYNEFNDKNKHLFGQRQNKRGENLLYIKQLVKHFHKELQKLLNPKFRAGIYQQLMMSQGQSAFTKWVNMEVSVKRYIDQWQQDEQDLKKGIVHKI